MITILVVGEAPSRRGSSCDDWTKPSSVRRRLCALMGMDEAALRERFDFVNLLDAAQPRDGKGSAFDMRAARSAGHYIMAEAQEMTRLVVFLGRRVASACGCGHDPYLFARGLGTRPSPYRITLPHLTSINRWYNDRRNKDMARAALRALIEDIEHDGDH
jgi:hypothetical protein